MPGSTIPSAERMQAGIDARRGIVRPAEQRIVSSAGQPRSPEVSLASRIAKARLAGYSDEEIVGTLATANPRVKAALDAGYEPAEIFKVLAETHTGQPYIDASRTRGNQAEIDRGGRGRAAQQQQAADDKGWLGNRVADARAGGGMLDLVAPKSGNAMVDALLRSPANSATIGARVLDAVGGAVNMFAAPAGRLAERHGMPEVFGSGPVNLAFMAIPTAPAARIAAALRPAATAARAAAPVAKATRIERALAAGMPSVDKMRDATTTARAAGVEPSLIDAGGHRGQRFARALGAKFPDAGDVLELNATNVRGRTQDAALSATRALTPEKRTADELAEALTKRQGEQATTDYKGPYQVPVSATAPAAEALRSQTGQDAMEAASRAVRDLPNGAATAGEIETLLSAARNDGELPQASARAYDLIKQQLSGMAQGFSASPETRMLGAGASNRANQIEDALKDIEELAPARQAYKNTARAIDALEKPIPLAGTDPADYARALTGISDEALTANQVAARQQLTDALGKGAIGKLSAEDAIANPSSYMGKNMDTAFGEAASPYRDRIAALIAQQRNASRAAPSGQSTTAMLAGDMGALDNVGAAVGAVTKPFRGNIIGAARDAVFLWGKAFGIDEAAATEIVTRMSDPAQLDAVLAMIERARGPAAKQSFIANVLPALRSGAATAIQQAPAAARLGAALQSFGQSPQTAGAPQ